MVKKTEPCTDSRCEKIENIDLFHTQPETETEKRTVLLHSCCGPCSTACIERLLPDYKVTVFFYNPNITDREEYERRREAQIKFLQAYNEKLSEEDRVEFIEGEYLPDDFFEVCSGFLKTGNVMFGTTLTVSPHKNYMLISAIGAELERVYGVEFLDVDFKKKAGFQRSIQMSKEYGLYRQNYCGCVYSMRTEDKK